MRLTVAILAFSTFSLAQTGTVQQQAVEATLNSQQQQAPPAQAPAGEQWVTIPSGTKVLLVLKNSISSKNAK